MIKLLGVNFLPDVPQFVDTFRAMAFNEILLLAGILHKSKGVKTSKFIRRIVGVINSLRDVLYMRASSEGFVQATTSALLLSVKPVMFLVSAPGIRTIAGT